MTATVTAPVAPITGGRTAFVVVAALHAAGLALLITGMAGGGVALAGAAVIAYTLGLRHALDADHIAMIDNSTRKFVAEGRRPATVGLAFSAGHSTVVIAAACLVIAGVSWATGTLDEGSQARHVLGLIGTIVAASYLAAIAITNIPVLRRAWRRLRSPGEYEETHTHGGLSRLLRAPLAGVKHPWQIYVFGLLFGLGFDTASSVALLMLATGAAGSTSYVGLLALPLLFAAAMTLGDSLNAYLMLRMYSSAQASARARFNVVITAVSIVAALAISIVTFAGLAVDLGLTWPVVEIVAGMESDWTGVGLIAVFVAVGAVAFVAARRRTELPDQLA